MNTQILPVNENSLELAKEIILSGGSVAFPTETVYGLGANAFDNQAVENIFKIKGRPNDNPLIVHVHKDYDILNLVAEVPAYAKKLAEAFLPGPLTMVYKSRGKVSAAVSCGLDTLAIRVPANEEAQRFLKFVDLPIAAPSANISKHVSPVAAEHVFADLNGKIRLILDGGRSEGGIESTVLDCTGEVPVVLRSGLVTREMIASVAGSCNEYVLKDGEKARSPGMKYKHYSPDCETMLFEFSEREAAAKAYDESVSKGKITFLLCDCITAKYFGERDILDLGSDEKQIAANLYFKLREGEKKADLIIAVAPEKRDGIMVGVMNRLTKACRSK